MQLCATIILAHTILDVLEMEYIRQFLYLVYLIHVQYTFFVRKLLFSNPLSIFSLVFGRGKAFPPFPSKFLGSINKGCSAEHALFRGCYTLKQ